VTASYHDRVNVLQGASAASPFDRAEWFALLVDSGLAPLIATAGEDAPVLRFLAALASFPKPLVAAVWPLLPEGMPVDDPDLEPIWAAADEADLPIMYHAFTIETPYFPGYRDIWDNPAMGRCAGQTWGGQTWGGQTWGGQTWGGQTWGGQTWGGQTWGGQTWASYIWN